MDQRVADAKKKGEVTEKVDRLFFDKEEDCVPEDVEEEDEGDDAAPVDVRDDRCHYEG